jgi:hypothetical protein
MLRPFPAGVATLTVASSARSREVGVAPEMLLTKAKQVGRRGVPPRGLRIEAATSARLLVRDGGLVETATCPTDQRPM